MLLPLYLLVYLVVIALMVAWITRATLSERRFYVCLEYKHEAIREGATADDRGADRGGSAADDDADDDRADDRHGAHRHAPSSRNAGVACYYNATGDSVFRATSMLCFLMLSAAIGAGALGIKRLGFRNARRRFLVPVSGRALYGASASLAALFLSHGLYDALVLARRVPKLPDLPLQGDKDLDLANFAMFLAWEYIPMMLILLTVGAPPPPRGRSLSESAMYSPSRPVMSRTLRVTSGGTMTTSLEPVDMK